MKEMYAQLGISSEVYDFGHEIEESLKERFDKFDSVTECERSSRRETYGPMR